jgi:hypothetical protein
MSEHKFVYTVSGVHLSDEQKTRVSQAIAGAVAGVIAGESPGEFRADSLTLGRIYGGIWILPPELRGGAENDPVATGVIAIAETAT